MYTSRALGISNKRQEIVFEKVMQHFKELDPDFMAVVLKRSDELVNTHTHFANYLRAKGFEVITAILAPEILGHVV